MEIKTVPIQQIRLWNNNPRNFKKHDLERLIKQIGTLGIYKPLICYEDDGKYVVLGGNARLHALRQLGHSEVEVSIVKPKSEAQKIEYMLSDNDRVSIWEQDKLAELLYPEIESIDLGEFKISLDESIEIEKFLKDFAPETNGKESNIPRLLKCPQCGREFSYKEGRME